MLLDPRFYLALVLAAVAGFFGGIHYERMSMAKEETKATQAARGTEGEIKHVETKATTEYLGRDRKQQEKARALPTIKIVKDCPVPADVGRVLNDAQHVSDDAGAGPSAGTTRTEADSTCAAELDIAKRNYAEVCIPNAEQLTELQNRWEEVRILLNQKGATRP